MNAWCPHRNAAGRWCAANRDGEHIACADHAAALAECDKRNRDEDADEALAAYRQAALTSPTFTGTASAPDLCQCQDGTGTCKYRRLDGGMLWQCGECRREWIVADTHTEEDDAGYWSSVVVFLSVFGSGLVLAFGFALGYVFRGWSA